MVKLTAYEIAVYAASQCLMFLPIDPQVLYTKVTPNRKCPFHVTSSNIGAPNFGDFTNSVTESLMNVWRFNLDRGIGALALALEFLYTNHDFKVHMCSSWNVFQAKCDLYLPPHVQIFTLKFPWIQSESNLHGLRVRCTTITIPEYIAITNRDPAHFMIDFMQILLFGFTVDRLHVEGLRMENEILSYITGCLRQGFIDSRLLLAMKRKHATSVFDVPHPQSARSQAIYTKIGKIVGGYVHRAKTMKKGQGFQQVPEHVLKMIDEMPDLGPNHNIIREASNLGLIKYNKAYSRYLNSTLPANLGYYSPRTVAELHMGM